MADQFIGKVLAEKYRIDSLMSEGSLGNIYHGTHLLMDKPVCIKVLPPDLAVDETIVKSFANEARTVSRISHPNILNVTDYGSDKDNHVFIVYEDANGETLKKAIQEKERFSLRHANKIVKEIAAALSVAHTNNIVHQNLSSDNVLLNNENLKVLNFGTTTFDINDLDYPVEKIEYLSPEQCTASSKIDNRTDIYALGVILYEMLAGEVPFTANNGTDLMLKHTQEPPPPITAFRNDLPNEVDDILLKALAKNPEIRYQNVNELADELNEVSLLVSDTDEEPVIVPQRALAANEVVTPNKSENNLWKTAFIVLAGISLLGASFIYLTSGKQTNPSTTLQTDANGSPVQPVAPPSGTTEQTLANMDSYSPNIYGNSNTGVIPPDSGGGTYNPYWDKGGRPPGAPPTTGGYYDQPYPVQPGGQQVYVDSNGSVFMPQDDGSYVKMVPKNANSNTASNVNTQPKKNANVNANVAAPPANTTVKPSPTPPAANTATPKTTPTPATTKPKATPKTEPTKPTTTEKRPVSGKEQDTN